MQTFQPARQIPPSLHQRKIKRYTCECSFKLTVIMLRLIVYSWFLKYLRYKIRFKKHFSSDSTFSVTKERSRESFGTSYFSRTTISATPCTCVSCLQSRDATSFLGPGWVGMKCSVSVTVEWAPTSLGGRKEGGVKGG